MKPVTSNSMLSKGLRAVCIAVLMCQLALTTNIFAQYKTTKAAPGATNAPRTFATPQEAADALIAAAEKFDEAALENIFGSEGKDLALTNERAQDQQRAKEFAALAREKKSVVVGPKNKNQAILIIGDEDWPFPVPIIKKSGRWSFNAAAGREEILFRRIGANELDAIRFCRGFVEAQHEYALQKRDGSGVNQYAQRIISTPGKQDGLAWQNPDGTWGGPIGEETAKVIQLGYTSRTEPFRGYYYKVLKGQGPAAPLGEMDFVIKGLMIGGFALVAAPAEYSVTGVKTFIVSHEGVVYEKDLGPQTLDAFKSMELYNPDKTWSPVKEN